MGSGGVWCVGGMGCMVGRTSLKTEQMVQQENRIRAFVWQIRAVQIIFGMSGVGGWDGVGWWWGFGVWGVVWCVHL